MKQHEFREKFRAGAPFRFDDKEAYERIDDVSDRLNVTDGFLKCKLSWHRLVDRLFCMEGAEKSFLVVEISIGLRFTFCCVR